MRAVQDAIACDLRRLLAGRVTVAAATLDERASDYGGLITRRPCAVVYPISERDVARTIRYARHRSLRVALRGSGHSQGGQSLAGDGITLDLTGLNAIERIDERGACIDAGAGARWHDVISASLERRLVPPVWTTNLFTTLGGTHAVGGVGPSSFRHGLQVDHCLAADVVTGSGERVRCGPREHADLFNAVQCGLGQFGVIIRLTHRLRPHGETAHTRLSFDRDRDRMIARLDALTVDPSIGFILAYATVVAGRWFYQIAATRETDGPQAADGDTPARPGLPAQAISRPFSTFALSVDHADPRRGPVSPTHPGIDVIVPRADARRHCATLLDELPPAVRANCRVGFMCLDRRLLTRPLFRTPAADHLLLITVQSSATKQEGPGIARALHDAASRSVALGATRYLPGIVDLTPRGWRDHFGDAWPLVHQLKRTYDPDGILIPVLSATTIEPRSMRLATGLYRVDLPRSSHRRGCRASSPWRKSRRAPRAARRPVDKARRPRISGHI